MHYALYNINFRPSLPHFPHFPHLISNGPAIVCRWLIRCRFLVDCLFGSAAQIAFGCISPVLRKWTSFTHLLVVLFPGKCKLCHCVSLLAFVQLLHFCSLNCKILLALNSSTHIRDILVSFWMRQSGVLCSFLRAKRGRGKANQLKVWQLRRLVGCFYLCIFIFFFAPSSTAWCWLLKSLSDITLEAQQFRTPNDAKWAMRIHTFRIGDWEVGGRLRGAKAKSFYAPKMRKFCEKF